MCSYCCIAPIFNIPSQIHSFISEILISFSYNCKSDIIFAITVLELIILLFIIVISPFIIISPTFISFSTLYNITACSGYILRV
nr:MAG TPA: hypothetical protein [Crassvirales sp.]